MIICLAAIWCWSRQMKSTYMYWYCTKVCGNIPYSLNSLYCKIKNHIKIFWNWLKGEPENFFFLVHGSMTSLLVNLVTTFWLIPISCSESNEKFDSGMIKSSLFGGMLYQICFFWFMYIINLLNLNHSALYGRLVPVIYNQNTRLWHQIYGNGTKRKKSNNIEGF